MGNGDFMPGTKFLTVEVPITICNKKTPIMSVLNGHVRQYMYA